MSLLTQMVLIEKYGLRVDLDRVAEILGTTPPNIRRKISAARFEIPTYIDNGKRLADIRDVAEYLDQRRQEARQAHGASPLASMGRYKGRFHHPYHFRISAAWTATHPSASRRRLRAGQPLLPRFDIRPRTFRVALLRYRLAQ